MGQPTFGVENLPGRNLNAELIRCETKFTQPCNKCLLRDNTGAASRKLGLDPFIDIHCPTGPLQQKAAQQAAHRAADNDCAPFASPGQWFSPDLFVYPFILYMTASSFGGIPMALTMLDKQAEKKDKSQWPTDIAAEFERESKNPNPCVGSTLLSENERTRVWIIRLAPGERIGFHRHVLDYFWTSVSGGRGRQHVHDGTTVEYTYQPGETRHETYGRNEFKVHDLENLGDREMVFMTVEFKDSANKPMPLPAGVKPQSAAA
jgi:quercetin dioxygenase-like cupin family protein